MPVAANESAATRTAIAHRSPTASRTRSIASSQNRARFSTEPPYASVRRLVREERNCVGRYECEP